MCPLTTSKVTLILSLSVVLGSCHWILSVSAVVFSRDTKTGPNNHCKRGYQDTSFAVRLCGR